MLFLVLLVLTVSYVVVTVSIAFLIILASARTEDQQCPNNYFRDILLRCLCGFLGFIYALIAISFFDYAFKLVPCYYFNQLLEDDLPHQYPIGIPPAEEILLRQRVHLSQTNSRNSTISRSSQNCTFYNNSSKRLESAAS